MQYKVHSQSTVHDLTCVLLICGAFCRWVLPFIGHMGICTSSGIIRDFAGSYFVSVSIAPYKKKSAHYCLQYAFSPHETVDLLFMVYVVIEIDIKIGSECHTDVKIE